MKPVHGEIRESQGKSKAWVARKIGVSAYSIANWESGSAMIPYDKARSLAQLYGVTMEELYKEDDHP